MWLYVTSRGYMPQSVVILVVLLMRQHLTRKNPEVVMCPRPWLYVSYRGYAWLYVVIYHICTEKMPEPSDDGFMWLYDQSRGYTPQFVVIRLVVLLMRQHLTSKTQPPPPPSWRHSFRRLSTHPLSSAPVTYHFLGTATPTFTPSERRRVIDD